MSNIFELCPKHFSKRGENISRGASSPCAALGYGPDLHAFDVHAET